ncbi:Mechanosensitive ion channel-domain-containing protein [Aspergillus ambiguus]|uniref:serine/threonine protein kinase n=1 Tax=Aspergillus ambiguus TaxID=176160 RepID=UPI003CCDA9AF
MAGRPGITEKKLSIHRFQQLPDHPRDHFDTPNDVTIEIPLNTVSSQSQTGARPSIQSTRSQHGYQPPQGDANASSEKTGLMPGRRRKIDVAKGRSAEDPEDGTVTRMGRVYRRLRNFSPAVKYIIYIIPVAVLLLVPVLVGMFVVPQATIGGVGVGWFFSWIFLLWIYLWICKLMAHILPSIFQFLCGIVSSGTRKYALILQSLEIPIMLALWTAVALMSFLPMMTNNPQQQMLKDTAVKPWEKSVKNVLFAIFVCSLIFLAEKTIVQLISISYHRKQFDSKIKESKRNVHLLAELYDASRSMFPMYCREFREEDAAISDSIAARKDGMSRSGSAPMRLFREVGQNVGRFGDRVTAAFGDVAHELTGKEVFNPTSARSIVTLALERRRSSEALARRIWMSFVIEGRDSLLHDDICEVLGAGKETEAEEAFLVLDRDGNGDISLDEMVMGVTEIARLKKSLNHSLHDVDQAINVLDNLLLSVAFIIGVLVFVSFVTSGFGTVIAAGATSLLSLSFVFSTTAQEVLGSCIFLFVKHPFDVGDRVEVDQKPYIVERISLLFTVFRNVGDHRTTQVPNAVLNTLWIDNFTRSAAMHEALTVAVNFDTTFTDIQLLKAEMEKFVRDKENCRDFQPDINIDVVGVGDMDKMELSVTICHKSNWANDTVRAARRSKFMCALISAVRRLRIRGPAGDGASPDDSNDKPDSDGTEKQAENANRSDTAVNSESYRKASGGTRSTGVDLARSSDSLHRRGANTGATSASTYSEGKYPEPVPGDGNEVDNYQTPNASPERKLAAPTMGQLAREPSTGRRKEGRTGVPTATGGVPILSAPVPPRQAASAAPQQAHQRVVAEYYRQTPGQYYDPQDGPYDPTQPFELPSMLEHGGPGAYPERAESPSLPSSIQPSPTNTRFTEEQMPGAFVSRRPQGN